MKVTWPYLAGFVDGEGCISIYDYQRKRTKEGLGRKHPVGSMYGFYSRQQGVRVTMSQAWRVTWSVSQKQDAHVLFLIRDFLHSEGITRAGIVHAKGVPVGVQVAHRAHVHRLLKQLVPMLIVKHGQAMKAITVLETLYPELV